MAGMDLLTGEDFNQLFRDFQRSAFHLETQDEYGVADEQEPFRKWLNGEPDDYEWLREWHELIKAATSAGKSVSRARIITEPVTDYIRFEHAMSRFNIEAGEQIFWVPRQRTGHITFPEHDFWLLDDELLAFNVFSADGEKTLKARSSSSRSQKSCSGNSRLSTCAAGHGIKCWQWAFRIGTTSFVEHQRSAGPGSLWPTAAGDSQRRRAVRSSARCARRMALHQGVQD